MMETEQKPKSNRGKLPCALCGKYQPKSELTRDGQVWVCKGKCEAIWKEDYENGVEVTPFFNIKKE